MVVCGYDLSFVCNFFPEEPDGDMKETVSITSSFDHLARINRATNQTFFLRGFSHAVVNPVNSILLGSELLTGFIEDINDRFDALTDDAGQTFGSFQDTGNGSLLTGIPQVVHTISSATAQLNQHLSNLSELIDCGSVAALTGLNFNQLVPLCTSMIQHKISEHTSHFSLEIEDNLPSLAGNPQHIFQMITNLLMNALLSLPHKSCAVSCSVKTAVDISQIHLQIQDQGAGIPEENLPRVVEPFFTTWQHHGCVGLGLTVADQIARSHGGKLHIDSKLGKGTTALVVLPLSADMDTY